MNSFMDYINRYIGDHPAQMSVISKILEYGLSIRDGKIFCNDIYVEFKSLAQACNVDQRVVKKVAEKISENNELKSIFEKFRCTMHLKDVAPELGYGEIVIVPFDAKQPGIISAVTSIIAERKISVRQAIVDDPYIYNEPKLYIITEEPIPAEIIPEIKKLKSVKSVTVF